MSELIDLVNSNGEIAQRAIERDDADKYNDLYMQIVIAVVKNGRGEVLVHQRAKTKRVNPGDIDHVCGGILSGETPEDAAIREAKEEVGIKPDKLEIVRQGINTYGRYCYLLSGFSEAQPGSELNPLEVEWAAYYPVETLQAKNESGEFTFVDGFFEDIELVAAQAR